MRWGAIARTAPRFGPWLVLAIMGAGLARVGGADDAAPNGANAKPAANAANSTTDDEEATNPARPARPLLGRHYWGDVEYFQGWRVQHDVQSDQFRLIDPEDAEKVYGSLDQCRQELQKVRHELKLPEMQGDAVILVHGIARSARSFQKMQLHLQQAGFTAFAIDYPSTRVDIPTAAGFLNSVVESMQGVRRIHFVAHSMGGLVVRAYLAKHQDSRLDRLVMIATPNQRAHLADMFRSNVVYKMAFGPAGHQLVGDPDGFLARLPAPSLPYAVIAGGRGTPEGFNPLIPGDDDGTVSVLSTRLAGAVDFTILPYKHAYLCEAPETFDYTVRFLKEGRLRRDQEPQPISRENVATAGGKQASKIQLIGNSELARPAAKGKTRR